MVFFGRVSPAHSISMVRAKADKGAPLVVQLASRLVLSSVARRDAVVEHSIRHGTDLFVQTSGSGSTRNIYSVCEWLSGLTCSLSPPCIGDVRITDEVIFLSERICIPVSALDAGERELYDKIYSDLGAAGFAVVERISASHSVSFDDAKREAVTGQRCAHNKMVGHVLSRANLLISCVLILMYKMVDVADRFGTGFKMLQATLDHQKRAGEVCHLGAVLHSLFFTWQSFRADPEVPLWHQPWREPTMWSQSWGTLCMFREIHPTFRGQRERAAQCFRACSPAGADALSDSIRDMVGLFHSGLVDTSSSRVTHRGFLYGIYTWGQGCSWRLSKLAVQLGQWDADSPPGSVNRRLAPFVWPGIAAPGGAERGLQTASTGARRSKRELEVLHFLHVHLLLTPNPEHMDVPMSSWMAVSAYPEGMRGHFEANCPHMMHLFDRVAEAGVDEQSALAAGRIGALVVNALEQTPAFVSPARSLAPEDAFIGPNPFIQPQEVLNLCEQELYFKSLERLTQFLAGTAHVGKRILALSKTDVSFIDVHHTVHKVLSQAYPGLVDAAIVVESKVSVFIVAETTALRLAVFAASLMSGGRGSCPDAVDVCRQIVHPAVRGEMDCPQSERPSIRLVLLWITSRWLPRKGDIPVASDWQMGYTRSYPPDRLLVNLLRALTEDELAGCAWADHIAAGSLLHALLSVLHFPMVPKAKHLKAFTNDPAERRGIVAQLARRFREVTFVLSTPLAPFTQPSVTGGRVRIEGTAQDAARALLELLANVKPDGDAPRAVMSMNELMPHIERHPLSDLMLPENSEHPLWSPVPDLLDHIVRSDFEPTF